MQDDLAGGNIASLTPDSVDQLVQVTDPISEKIIQLVAKHNALEDCQAIIKKSFEKENMPLKEFLKNIRELAMKQSKTIVKMNKINQSINSHQTNSDPYNLGEAQPYQQQQ